MCVGLLLPCGHLLGKGWPLGPRLWCLIVKLSLSQWCPWSGVVLDCVDSWSLPSFFLSLNTRLLTPYLLVRCYKIRMKVCWFQFETVKALWFFIPHPLKKMPGQDLQSNWQLICQFLKYLHVLRASSRDAWHCCVKTIQAQTCLRIHAVWSHPLLFTLKNVYILNLLRAKYEYTQKNWRILKFFWLYYIWENNFKTKYFRIW